MNYNRVGVLYASESGVPPKKKLKPAFFEAQEQARVVKIDSNGRIREFLVTNFCNEISVSRVLLGDSIVDNICLNGCVTYSLRGGCVKDFEQILPNLATYRKVIIALGGNNLSRFDEPGEEPAEVLRQMQQLVTKLKEASNRPDVTVCTVLRRTKAKHDYILKFNELLTKSELSSFKLHREVYKKRNFMEDGVHLTLRGRKIFACAIKKLRIEKYGENLSF